MKSEKKHRLNTYHKYTLLFVVMYTICCGLFFVAYGRGYFRWADGFDQHYQSFSYIGRSIRQFFVKLFTEHKYTPVESGYSYDNNVVVHIGYTCGLQNGNI